MYKRTLATTYMHFDVQVAATTALPSPGAKRGYGDFDLKRMCFMTYTKNERS